MRGINSCASAGLWACLLVAGTAMGQADTVSVDLTGVLVDFPNPPDLTRDSVNNPAPGSASFINAEGGYAFSINGLLQLRDPIFGAPLGSPILLTSLLDQLQPGNSRLLSGWIRNGEGGLPPGGIIAWQEQFVGGAFGAELDIRLEVTVSEAGVVTFAVRDIMSSLGFLTPTLDFDAGIATLSTWAPSPRQLTEWHFDGDFSAAPGSDDSQIRYLDDAAFGTILGGIGNEEVPSPSTPFGVTEAQSSFTDTAAAGLPAPGGVDTGVYLTSPAVNLSNPSSDALRRGIGLSVYPAAKPAYPGGFIGQWSMVWDMLIPASSWFADFPANTQPNQFLAALVQDQHNNDSGADIWLRHQNGSPTIVYTSDGDGFFSDMPLALPISPDTWFRLALVCDEFQEGVSRVFVDGVFIGEIESDWVYNAVDPTPGQQFYGDGQAVDPADWAAWGEFPSPWALSEGTINPDPDSGAPVPVPLASTFSLFSDLRFGGSQPVYLANLLWVDDLMPDSEVIALGGANGAGIVLTGGPAGCSNADIAEPFDVLDLSDITAFVQAFTTMQPAADVALPEGVFDLADITAFVASFLAGCP